MASKMHQARIPKAKHVQSVLALKGIQVPPWNRPDLFVSVLNFGGIGHQIYSMSGPILYGVW